MPIVGDRRNPYLPPAGVLYFLIHDEERREKGYTFLSPLGELYFLMTSSSLLRLMTQFPSPLGELYFLIRSKIMYQNCCRKWFPSPLGELYFLIKTMTGVCISKISVPSRGAIFLNHANCCAGVTPAKQFPSPLGELYFLIIQLYDEID